jgi:hypothetical protein
MIDMKRTFESVIADLALHPVEKFKLQEKVIEKLVNNETKTDANFTMHLVQQLAPSKICKLKFELFFNVVVVRTGGRLFDDFVLFFMNKSQLNDLSNDSDALQNFIDKYANAFWLHLLQLSYGKSRKNGKLLVPNVNMLQSKGLSHSGVEVLHSQLLAPSVSTVKRHNNISLQAYQKELDVLVKKYSTMYWIDNFNMFLKYSSLRKSPYENHNWSAFACKISEQAPLLYTSRLEYTYHEQSHHILMELLDDNHESLCNYKSQYNNTQIKYSPPLVSNTTPKLLNNFFPIGLIDANCGSNQGLQNILLAILKPMVEQSGEYYIFLKVDINLYYRILKVCLIVKVQFILQ